MLRFRRFSVVGALGVVIAGCGGGSSGGGTTTTVAVTLPPAVTSPSTTAPPSTTTTTTVVETTTTVPVERFALTGLPILDPALAQRPALAVKMDNHKDARPHAGLNQADVVYEEIVEGITRFFVIFHSTDAAPIGPIRSARTTDVDLLNQLNRPLFAWSGGNGGVVRAIGQANAESRAHGQVPGYYRDEERDARADREHTLLHEGTALLYTTAVLQQGLPPQMFEFREDGETASGDPVVTVDLDLNSVPVTWAWDAPSATWVRSEYGELHTDTTGTPISAENVIFQWCDYRRSAADPKSPEAVTVGSGDVIVFTDGRVQLGTWERPDPAAPAVIRGLDGDVIKLTPGRTWIELGQNGQSEVVWA